MLRMLSALMLAYTHACTSWTHTGGLSLYENDFPNFGGDPNKPLCGLTSVSGGFYAYSGTMTVIDLSALQSVAGNLRIDGGNALTRLPASFEALKSLRTLNLASNQLSRLPVTFGGLVALETLDLYDLSLIHI